MTPDESRHLRALAERVRRLPAYCAKRPHAFLEDKQDVAYELDQLATLNAEPVRQPDRDLKASFGPAMRRTVAAGRGGSVIVERRQRPAESPRNAS